MIAILHVTVDRANPEQADVESFLVKGCRMLKGQCESTELHVAKMQEGKLALLLDYADVSKDSETGVYLAALAKEYQSYWSSEYGLDIEYIGEEEAVPHDYLKSIVASTSPNQEHASTTKRAIKANDPGF